MGVLSCQTYVVDLLQGLTSEYSNAELQATQTEPIMPSDAAMQPIAYVLCAESDGKRQTMAGEVGYYVDTRKAYVTVYWSMQPGGEFNEYAFPNLIDTINQTIRSAYQGVVTLTDPATGGESSLLAMAQHLSSRILPPMNLGEAEQEWLLYQATLIFDMEEKIQYGLGNGNIGLEDDGLDVVDGPGVYVGEIDPERVQEFTITAAGTVQPRERAGNRALTGGGPRRAPGGGPTPARKPRVVARERAQSDGSGTSSRAAAAARAQSRAREKAK